MPKYYIEAIEHARVYDVAIETPCELAPKLSARLHNEILLKREDLQPVFSFKVRGAYNKIAHLSEEERNRGVICASAGNHAQGVALSAKKIGIKATIVMPRTTPEIKVKAVESYGAQVVLFGDSYSDASEHASNLRQKTDMTYIHPYDDPLVIAGQGTIAAELLRQTPSDIDVIFVPVGGGGLISGIAAYIKQTMPETRVIGVEPVDSSAMHDSVAADELVTLKQVGIFADGVAVKKVGSHTFDLVRQFVDEILLVDTDEICAAVKDIYDENRSIVEPAGALAVAGMKKYIRQHKLHGKVMACVNSGANMNFDRLRHIAERAEMGERREALFAVTIDEKPGSFLTFCKLLGDRAITEFNYRLSSRERAHVFVGIAITSEEERLDIINLLQSHHYPVIDLMENEAAKLHLRHIVGGKSVHIRHEHLYRFEFPERPSALLDFLIHIAGRWNISLFHYRNHGAAFGRVLVGIEVPKHDEQAFEGFVLTLGYSWVNESDNAALQLFL